MSELFLKLNLQLFADDVDTTVEDATPEPSNDDNTTGEEDLLAAIQSILNEDNEEPEDPLVSEPEKEEAEVKEDIKENDEIEEEVEKEEKKVQSKEDNAKFAAERRQREMEEQVQARVQAELDRVKREDPAYQLAETLSKQYNQPVDAILNQIREQQLQQEAEKMNVPVEELRAQRQAQQMESQRVSALEQELNQLKYQQWVDKIQSDTKSLQGKYNFLEQTDFDEAVNYILHTVQNVNVSLEQAIFATKGARIAEELAKQNTQEELAKQSGRSKKTPPAPNNGKPSKVQSATEEQRYVAKMLGMSVEDYLKYE